MCGRFAGAKALFAVHPPALVVEHAKQNWYIWSGFNDTRTFSESEVSFRSVSFRLVGISTEKGDRAKSLLPRILSIQTLVHLIVLHQAEVRD